MAILEWKHEDKPTLASISSVSRLFKLVSSPSSPLVPMIYETELPVADYEHCFGFYLMVRL
ncbi:hypothetical protein AALP_AA2G246000 [Arabis alpina]|uniref:Uncharacterized protein n=1 Tax=Arabis alpina TaxID=50452 RepID=A0A087HJR3_ARAAL|nr:hypothetical protein AALP_AA2G246000 [Arabis alpina]